MTEYKKLRSERADGRRIWAVSYAVVLWTISTIPSTMNGSDLSRLHVMTSTTDLASLVRDVGGDRVDVNSLSLGYQDPHFVPVTAGSLLKLNRADKIMLVNLQMESAWLGDRLGALSSLVECRNPRIQFGSAGYFDLSAYAEVVDIPNEVTRAQGYHPLGNAHYRLDPENGRSIAHAVATKLSKARPTDAPYFQQRLASFDRRLSEKTRSNHSREYHLTRHMFTR